jgi:hypothetical protein
MVRLGIVLEDGTAPDVVVRLAILAERAGLDGLWLAPWSPQTAPQEPLRLLKTLTDAAERTSTIVLGAYFDRLPDAPARLADRLEAVLPTDAKPDGHRWTGRMTMLTEGPPAEVPPDVDEVVIPIWAFSPPMSTMELPPLPVAVELSTSIGRTVAEATARLDSDHRLRDRRDPRRGGLFGTLEQCQARVAELARAGVTEVRCWLPDTPDVHDVIAQLSAVKVGALEPTYQGRHAQPPSPPAGWGGRARNLDIRSP